MFKETAIRLLIGIAGTSLGALFVLTLKGAAVADAQRLHAAKARAETIETATSPDHVEEVAALAARVTTWPPRTK